MLCVFLKEKSKKHIKSIIKNKGEQEQKLNKKVEKDIWRSSFWDWKWRLVQDSSAVWEMVGI